MLSRIRRWLRIINKWNTDRWVLDSLEGWKPFSVRRIIGIVRIVNGRLRADWIRRVDRVSVWELFSLWRFDIFVNFEMLSQRGWMSVRFSAAFDLKKTLNSAVKSPIKLQHVIFSDLIDLSRCIDFRREYLWPERKIYFDWLVILTFTVTLTDRALLTCYLPCIGRVSR